MQMKLDLQLRDVNCAGEKGKGFAERLSENGFFVREVPRDMYHYEYQDQSMPGTYHILQAMKLP